MTSDYEDTVWDRNIRDYRGDIQGEIQGNTRKLLGPELKVRIEQEEIYPGLP